MTRATRRTRIRPETPHHQPVGFAAAYIELPADAVKELDRIGTR